MTSPVQESRRPSRPDQVIGVPGAGRLRAGLASESGQPGSQSRHPRSLRRRPPSTTPSTDWASCDSRGSSASMVRVSTLMDLSPLFHPPARNPGRATSSSRDPLFGWSTEHRPTGPAQSSPTLDDGARPHRVSPSCIGRNAPMDQNPAGGRGIREIVSVSVENHVLMPVWGHRRQTESLDRAGGLPGHRDRRGR